MLKISISHPYSIALLGVAVVILGLGVAFRPAKNNARPLSETDVARIQQLSQERRLSELSRYLADAANKASRRLLFLDTIPHTAVVWDDNRAVTSAPPIRLFGAAIGRTGQMIHLKVAPTSGPAPFTVLTVPSAYNPEALEAQIDSRPDPGSWVLAVARSSSTQLIYSQGLYQGELGATCHSFPYSEIQSSVVLSPALEGGALFTLSGQLLGIIFSCDHRLLVMSHDSVRESLRHPASPRDILEQTYGLTFSDSPSTPLLLTAVWTDKPARSAGFLPGDTLIAVDDQPVASLSALPSLLSESAPHRVTAERKKRSIVLDLSPETPGTTSASFVLGLTLDFDATQVVVTYADPNGTGFRSGIRAGDILLRSGTITLRNPAQAAQLLGGTRGRPVNLEIARGHSRAQVLLAP